MKFLFLFNICSTLIFLSLVYPVSCDCTSLSACDDSCQQQGYFTDTSSNSCKLPSFLDCITQAGYQLCSDPSKICNTTYGFVNKQGDCDFPYNCDSDSQGCSLACKGLAYYGTENCKPQTDSYCQDDNNKACQYPQNACVTQRGWLQGQNGVCSFPDCSLPQACQNDCCILLGYFKNQSTNDCIIPTVDECLENNQIKCNYKNSPCVSINFLTQGQSGICKLPSNCLDLNQPCKPACTYLQYINDINNNCANPTNSSCLTKSQNKCQYLQSACVANLGWTPDNQNDCTFPINCLSDTQNCSQACIYLNYVSNGSKCIYPESSFCLNQQQNYCSIKESACFKFGWSLIVQQNACSNQGGTCINQESSNENNNNSISYCGAPTNCLQSCESQACQYLGYIKENGSCRPKNYEECEQIGINLCALPDSVCKKLGFAKKNDSNDCEYPSNCQSDSLECSQICLHLNYQTESNKCQLPSNQEICIKTDDDYCKNDQRACVVLGWKKNESDNKCQKPNCLSSKDICKTSACNFIGYEKNEDLTCKTPSFEDCLQMNQNSCGNSQSICLNFGFTKSPTSNDCQVPNCLGDLQTCQNPICTYLGYKVDGGLCKLPTFDSCQESGNNNCAIDQYSVCIKIGFIKQSTSSDCQFPNNCLSSTNPCSDICNYLNYVTNGSTCQYLDQDQCLSSNSNYCSIPEKSCRAFGWDKNVSNSSCQKPDCLNSSDSCLKNACQYLQYIRLSDNTCKQPTIDQCLQQGLNRCKSYYSMCILKGFKNNQINGDCSFPEDCLTQNDCSSVCSYLGYIKSPNNSCKMPTHESCLNVSQSQCSIPQMACSILGWDKTPDGLSCQNPNCKSDINICKKDACDYLGYIKQPDNSCIEPTVNQCLDKTQNRCSNQRKICTASYSFLLNSSGDCDLPTNCQTRSDQCPQACSYIGFVQDKSSPQLTCKQPGMEDCADQNNSNLCSPTIKFCTDYGWTKPLSQSQNFCILPNCLIGEKCGTGNTYRACLYSGYIKNDKNNQCLEPTDNQCLNNQGSCMNKNTVCQKRGWSNKGNGDCQIPDCLLVGGAQCAQGKTACLFSGYVKSSASDDCILPNFTHCANKQNIYLCSDNLSYCTSIGFVKTSIIGKNYCQLPSDCETNINACQSDKIACQIKGYVKDKNSNKCLIPLDVDCNNQNNIYACFDLVNGFCGQQNWKKISTEGQYSCITPSDCLQNNQCQYRFTACQFLGYVNNYSSDNCILPTDEHCQNQVYENLCREDVSFCTSKGYIKQPDSNKCKIPDCLNGKNCKPEYTACTYIGYLAKSDGTCKTPQNDDCMYSSPTNLSQLCRLDIPFCTNLGYKRSTANPEDNYCVFPTDCKNSLQCASQYTACTTLGYKKGNHDDVCYEPSDFDCYDNIKYPDLCRDGVTFCVNRGWSKNIDANFCEPPQDCTTGFQCQAGLTACLFLGYVSDLNGKCIIPKDVDCANTANQYTCKDGNTFCTSKGWKKITSEELNYCVAPSDDECLNEKFCSAVLEACKYIGYVNNGIDDGCVKPSDTECMDNLKFPYLCRNDIFFCTVKGYIKDTYSNKCLPPTDCLGNMKCGGFITACLYNGFIPFSDQIITCKLPVKEDCENKSNIYLCRDQNFDCIKKFKYVKIPDNGKNYCDIPSQCLTDSGQCSDNSICLTLGYIKKNSSYDCKYPSDADCQNTSNQEACGEKANFCKVMGWVKNLNQNDNSCVAPYDCLSGDQCSTTLSACKYIGYLKASVESNQCSIPTDDQCLNPAINSNLCSDNIRFCTERGWVKSSQDNSCTKPSDCLQGEQCGLGKICVFLGYVSQPDSSKCKIPQDDDCYNQSNAYTCKPGNTFCTSRGWVKVNNPLQNYCVPEVDCLVGEQCSPDKYLCIYLGKFLLNFLSDRYQIYTKKNVGYVKIPNSNRCRIPTDQDCQNQTNNLACRSTSSFCYLKGWQKSNKNPSDNFCVQPNCLDGLGRCSSNFTACKYYGYMKKVDNDDSCRLPEEEDCINQQNNLCDPKINFCTDKGFVKVQDPASSFCVLPNDCLQGEQCKPQYTACTTIGGYVSNDSYKCQLPTDEDCIDINLTLCREGIDTCTKRGYLKSTNKPADKYCVVPDCINKVGLCNPKLSACQFEGYLKHPENDNCISPTDEDCFNPENKYLCRSGNQGCPYRGWIRDPENPINNQCILPSDCLTSDDKCGYPFTACTFVGYLKDPAINNNSCIIPSIEECLDRSNELCKYSISPCISYSGFQKASDGNYCVYPDNCLSGIQCNPQKIACKLLGYVPLSETLYKCVLPSDQQCLTQKLCYSDQSRCIKMGYKKVNDDCVSPDNCVQGQQCSDSSTACKYFGYLKNQNDDSCYEPSFNDCYNNLSRNFCSQQSKVCKKYGFIQDDNQNCIIRPEQCGKSTNILCQDDIKYCTNLGWIKSNNNGKCSPPQNCLGTNQCSLAQSACLIIGYVQDQNGVCQLPLNCFSGSQCSDIQEACLKQGFTRNITNNTLAIAKTSNSHKTLLVKSAADECLSLSECNEQCLSQGYFTDVNSNQCKMPSLIDCITQKESQLCSDLSKICVSNYGFVNNNGNCQFPENCDSDSLGCSKVCLALAYFGQDNCKPQTDDYCQDLKNKACLFEQSGCFTQQKGWLKGQDGICNFPDCTLPQACKQSSCIFLGYIKNEQSYDCTVPSVEECLINNQVRCKYINSPCVIINQLPQDVKCQLPSNSNICLTQNQSCNPTCLYLQYLNDENNNCANPTSSFCLFKSSNKCKYKQSACIQNLGWVADDQNDCTLPENSFCLNDQFNYCSNKDYACARLGWQSGKNQQNKDTCVAPLNCLESCDSQACQYLGYVKKNDKCGERTYEECEITGLNLCALPYSVCQKLGFNAKGNTNDCEYPKDCQSDQKVCSQMCLHLNYISGSNSCELPQKQEICLQTDDDYCENDSRACSVLGWKRIDSSKKCEKPACLSSIDICQKKACKSLGYLQKDDKCVERTYEECEITGLNLCALPYSVCQKLGFNAKGNTNDCEYPKDCQSDQKVCSQMCLHLNYISGSNSCELPQKQEICLQTDDDYCENDSRACSVLGWKRIDSSNKCEKPNCLSSLEICNKSACKSLGYLQKDDKCVERTYEECEITGLNLCALPYSVCQKLGFNAKGNTNDCEYPKDCQSDQKVCSQMCLHLNYIPGSNSCELPQKQEICLQTDDDYCENDSRACSVLGWKKIDSSKKCEKPACLSSIDICQKKACKSLGYLQKDDKCVERTYEECEITGLNLCALPYSVCQKLGFNAKGNTNDCEYPKDCQSDQKVCSQMCLHLNYIPGSNSCELPQKQEICLQTDDDYCENDSRACSVLGWKRIDSSNKCEKPNCLSSLEICNKSACKSLGYLQKDDKCVERTYEECEIIGLNLCALPYSVCQKLGFNAKGNTNDCEYPKDCQSDQKVCSQMCLHLNYIPGSNSCELPQKQEICLQTDDDYCENDSRACSVLGWKRIDSSNKCEKPNCLSSLEICNKSACKSLGYLQKDDKCVERTYEECEITGLNLCALPYSVCQKLGFNAKGNTNDCEYPKDCQSDQKVCSQMCLHLNYIPGSNSCELPQKQEICLQTDDDYCENDSRACSVLGWKKIDSSKKCEKPACLSSIDICQKKACKYLGYDKNEDQSCKTPSKEDCLQVSQNRCQNSLTICQSYGFIQSSSSDNNCQIPDCMSNILTCKNQICSYLGYLNDGENCQLPSIKQCQQIGNDNCVIDKYSACIKKGFIKQYGSSDCELPQDCFSLSQSCSDVCIDLKYSSIGNTCQYLDQDTCLTPNSEYCSIPQKSCRAFGWIKSNDSSSCQKPNCIDSSISCQSKACQALQYIKQANDTCRLPTVEECLQIGLNRCSNHESACIISLGFLSNNIGECVFPNNCKDQNNCSEACTKLGFTKPNGICQMPTHQDCLTSTDFQCSLPQKVCSTLGWEKTQDGSKCQNPDCKSDIKICSKDACDYLGYIKQIDNSCIEPTFDQCLEQGKNRCSNDNKLCITNYSLMKNSSGDCEIPTDCETRQGKCPQSCLYIGYLPNKKSPYLTCKKPEMEDCADKNNANLCSPSIKFCTNYGWTKSPPLSETFCVLKNCLSGYKCESGDLSSACFYAGYIKNKNNNQCLEPTDNQCLMMQGLCKNKNTVCQQRGWSNNDNGDCQIPDCLQIGAAQCAQGKTACLYSGYVKSSTSDDCIKPNFTHCADRNNIYLCADNYLKYCTSIGFVKTSSIGYFYCQYPTDCEQKDDACQPSNMACQLKGYVKDKNSNKCMKPKDVDCNNQDNIYACFDLVNGFCGQQNWKKTPTEGQYSCNTPSDCTQNNQCQYSFTSCQYLGYVNNYSSSNCMLPTDEHCQNQVYENLCRKDVTFCTSKGYVNQPGSNKCKIPDCLDGQNCKEGYTACTYIGYIAKSDGTCKIPQNDDCMSSSPINLSQLCRLDIPFCTDLGYKRSTANPEDNYCVFPTDCKDSLQCASQYTACITLGYKKGAQNDVCYEPSDFDCQDNIKYPDLCKDGVTFCINRGWSKNIDANFCEAPKDCTYGLQCQAGLTACLFLGYVSNQDGKCILPQDTDCANINNQYLCKKGNTFCTDKGWQKAKRDDLNYCVPPTDDECLNEQRCSASLEACKYIGYVNNGINDGCAKPSDKDCLDSINNPQLCRSDIFFCTGRGYTKDTHSNKCLSPTDCVGNMKCGGQYTACLYNGYIPFSDKIITCQQPTKQDCENKDNKYLCRDSSFDCIDKFKYVQTSDVGQYYCEKPSICISNPGQCTDDSICLTLGYVKKNQSSDCQIPSDADCQNPLNSEACGTKTTLCYKMGWVKNPEKNNNSCVAPFDCLQGEKCSSSLSACKYIGFLKASVESNSCSIPTDDQCLNPAINSNLCRDGVKFCTDRGWVKSNQDNSCDKPSDCLQGEQCGLGKICIFLGYVAENGSSKCKIPSDDDCYNQSNSYACKSGNKFCTSRGWVKVNDPFLNYCVPEVDCLNGDQCSPDKNLCLFLGYVQIPNSYKCRIPTDKDCENKSNNLACRTLNSFCSLKGWQQSKKKPTDTFCVLPDCLDGLNRCSSTQSACRYYGYMKSETDDSCRLPEDDDCMNNQNNLCDNKISFCTNKGFVKVKDPSSNNCELPKDCLQGEQCKPEQTACTNIGGYVRSSNSYKCQLPTDEECIDSNLTLCREGIEFCKNKGYVKSTNRPTDKYCVIPDCLNKVGLCNSKLSACLFIGFLKDHDNDNCVAPTDDDCFNPNNKYLCRTGNIGCPSRGWTRDPFNALEKQCIPPTDCLTADNKCGNPYTACKYIGYLKNPINNMNSCVVPSIKQCLDKNQELCKYTFSPCISFQGFEKAKDGNYCVYPTDCLSGIQCNPNRIACKLLGYVSQSETLFKCVLPSNQQCLNQKLCYSDQSVCIQNGYQKVNDECVSPDNCLQGQLCSNQNSACQYLGYVKSQKDDSCVEPSFSNCLDNTQPNLCSDQSKVCKKYGFVKDTNQNCTISVQECAKPINNLCLDDIKYCTDLGWIKSNDSGKCTPPIDCLNSNQCNSDQSACAVIGYIKDQNGLCSYPTDCLSGSQCSDNKQACLKQGFVKNPINDSCLCPQSQNSKGNIGKCLAKDKTLAFSFGKIILINILTILTLLVFL
ncbi:hypothetical protein ABPG74_010011 [Tetrahymena malaccensis]